ncbi:uncharacterized protein LOC134531841 [Bacillus rossius redtenbacheri]|uniref:uncharacterized protein LOC134531841 n=1 Tax=Bacillus rossius redtenbacheri TaxID=93214 RepID=UPI002FDC9784
MTLHLPLLLLLLLVLGAPSCLGVYPIQKSVVYDPRAFDVLYHSAKGVFQETWSFTKAVKVTAFILASQVNLCGGGEGYRENVTLTISKVDRGTWTSVAEAQLLGDVAYGRELRVSLLNSTAAGYPLLQPSGVFYYSVGVLFGGEAGVYPWHTTRSFSGACAAVSANNPGNIIGIEYTW